MSRTLLCSVFNSAGLRFNVAIVPTGARYGLDDCLTNDGPDALIEFYDDRYKRPGFDPVLGQFVSRYRARDLVDRPVSGLNLNGGVPAWQIDRSAMDVVVREIAAKLATIKEA